MYSSKWVVLNLCFRHSVLCKDSNHCSCTHYNKVDNPPYSAPVVRMHSQLPTFQNLSSILQVSRGSITTQFNVKFLCLLICSGDLFKLVHWLVHHTFAKIFEHFWKILFFSRAICPTSNKLVTKHIEWNTS